MTTTPIPAAKFGKDHWSTLAYIETRCVDGKLGVGFLDHRRMRTNEVTHPLLSMNSPLCKWQKSWGTRLRGFFEFEQRNDLAAAEKAGFLLSEHDDWDCLDDLAAAGYVEILSLANGAVRMLDAGFAAAAKLRKHKAEGGQFATFQLDSEEALV